MEDVFNDPHYAAREMIVDVPDDDLGSVKLANIVPRLSETPGEIRKAGGQPGVDTRSVLGDFTDLTTRRLPHWRPMGWSIAAKTQQGPIDGF